MGDLARSLPASLSPLIGRDEDVAAVIGLVRQNRLVTLAGPPGIGKTRLAIEVATVTPEDFSDGTWFVDLAPVVDAALVVQAVARSLGVREEAGHELTETLIAYLAARDGLLVLDNCEHLIAVCAELSGELLRRCGHLTILTTSREPLGITGELTWRVPPLTVPRPGDVDMETAGVRLFCERATAIDSRFATCPIPSAVGDICRRLDGVALAIELAAARVDALSPMQIAERLSDRFALLTVGSRTALARHQTMRAAIDWSHDLLPPEEQVLLRRLSVFVGSWSAEAAEEVCSGDGVERASVLPVLARLVSKSLVVNEVAGDRPRFRMLETIRDYGLDKLAEADESFDLAARHAAWAVRVAEHGNAQLHGPAHQTAIDALDAEHDNVRVALRWALNEHQGEIAQRIAAGMAMFWGIRGHLSEGREWLLSASVADDGAPTALAAATLWGAGFLTSLASDFLGAQAILLQSLAVAERARDKRHTARSLFTLGICALFIRDRGPQAALGLFHRSVSTAREGSDTWCLVCALAGVAWVRNIQGDPTTARSLLQECLAVARQAEAQGAVATTIHLLGVVAMRQGDLATAEVVLAEATTLARTLGDVRLTAEALHSLGEVALRRGDLMIADRLFDESLTLARSIGTRSATLGALCSLGEVARQRGDPTTARAFYTESIAVAWQIGATCSPALVGLSQISLALGDPWAAEALLDQALSCAGNAHERASALHEKGSLCRGRGDLETATALHVAALRLWAELRDPLGTAQSFERLAGLAAANGHHDHAARLFGAAHRVREGTDVPVPLLENRRWYDADVAMTRQGLMSDEFEAAWAHGEAMSADEAVALGCNGTGVCERPAAGWTSLTRAEREVAALVAENLTNREIGERLFISPRTVQTHLAHVFAKLGFASRRDLARLVARRHATLDVDVPDLSGPPPRQVPASGGSAVPLRGHKRSTPVSPWSQP